MQLRQPPDKMSRRTSPRYWSRGRGCLVFGLVGVLALLFACAVSMALYVVFPPAPLDILVMGLDSRGNEGRVTRTDSIMLVNIDPGSMDVSLLSIPRDLFIQVPGYGLERINTVNVLAEMEQPGTGPALLARSINENFDVQLDRYVRLDFQAFVAVVDAVGGLEIDVPDPIVDYQFPTADYGTTTVRFDEGVQQMDGETALIYARTRHADDDYRRAERQQQVVTALGKKLLNPTNWPVVWAALQQHVETNVSVFDLLPLIPPILFSGGNYEQLVIDRESIVLWDGYATPDYEALAPWIQAHFD